MMVALRMFAIAIATLFAQAPARAADPPSTMLIIDGSGSMWGAFEPEKRAKVDLVRDRMLAILAAAPSARVAVASYGHRRRADCSDAEVIAGFDSPRDIAVEAIAKLNPRGKGALTAALGAAYEAIGATRPANVVIIADGADNCWQDACAVASELAKTSPGVPAHVVAVGPPSAELPRLQCIADLTGGQLFEAPDPIALISALDAASKVAMLTPDVAAPASAAPSGDAPAASGPSTVFASVTLADGGPALSMPARWRVFQAGGDKPLAESDGASLTVRLEEGRYEIEARIGRISARKPIVVEAGRRYDLPLPIGAARLTVKAANAQGAAAASTTVVTIAPENAADDETAAAPLVFHGGAVDVVLSPATYAVSIADNASSRFERLALAAGDVRALEVALESGRLDLTTSGVDGAPLNDVAFTISQDDPESPSGRRVVARSRAPSPSFTLPSGTYYVDAESGGGLVRDRVAISAGETVARTIALPLARVRIAASIAGAPAAADDGVVYRITALDGEPREVTRSVEPVVEARLTPGRYRIAARLDAHHIGGEREVLIEAGKPAELTIDIAAAEIRLKAPVASGDAFWEIRDSSGKPVWRTQLGEPKALLPPGRYQVRFEHRDLRLEASFEAAAGERRTVELGPK